MKLSYHTLFSLLAGASAAGCANTHWERAWYQSSPENSPSCAIRARPTDPPCVRLPDYDTYERERETTRSTLPLRE
jgi:hypothetical protein